MDVVCSSMMQIEQTKRKQQQLVLSDPVPPPQLTGVFSVTELITFSPYCMFLDIAARSYESSGHYHLFRCNNKRTKFPVK